MFCAFKLNVCLHMDLALTLKYISIPFDESEPTYTVHIGATVFYKGQPQPAVAPEEQRLLVVGEELSC